LKAGSREPKCIFIYWAGGLRHRIPGTSGQFLLLAPQNACAFCRSCKKSTVVWSCAKFSPPDVEKSTVMWSNVKSETTSLNDRPNIRPGHKLPSSPATAGRAAFGAARLHTTVLFLTSWRKKDAQLHISVLFLQPGPRSMNEDKDENPWIPAAIPAMPCCPVKMRASAWNSAREPPRVAHRVSPRECQARREGPPPKRRA